MEEESQVLRIGVESAVRSFANKRTAEAHVPGQIKDLMLKIALVSLESDGCMIWSFRPSKCSGVVRAEPPDAMRRGLWRHAVDKTRGTAILTP